MGGTVTVTATSHAPSMATSGRGRWLGLAMLSVGVAMIIVDATIVNVAVPRIISDLTLDGTTAEWINTTYALVFAALLITLGRLGDLTGRRLLYLLGLGIFAASSVLAGVADSGGTLIAARLFQGLGGAMILPATQSILNTNFQGRDRAIAFGIWGSVIGGMAAVGPLLGGWLTTEYSWRWAFLINVPIAAIAILGTVRFIRESRDPEAARGFDLAGFLLVTLGLGGVVFALIEGRTYGWTTPTKAFEVAGLTWGADAAVSFIPVLAAVSTALLLAFWRVEVRRKAAGSFYLFDFDIWRVPTFRFGNLAGTIVSLGEFGLLFALPLFLQGVLGLSAFETGLVFLSLAIGAFFAAPAAAGIARRFGPRRVITLGMGLEAVGIIWTTLLIAADLDPWAIVPSLFVYGVGVGFATAQLTSVVLADVPPRESGLASGTNSTMRQVGSALGIAILGTVLFSTLLTETKANLAAVPGLPAVARDGIAAAIDASAGQALVGFRADPAAAAVVKPIEDAFVTATRQSGFVAFGFVVLGFVFSLLLPAPHGERGYHRTAGIPDQPEDAGTTG
jgi:EmrB/QacA subfamily drug resistance transporter